MTAVRSILLVLALGHALGVLGPACAWAQKRPRPLIVELKQNSILALPAGQTQGSAPLLRGGNLLFVRVALNDQDAGFFLVDTGANATLIDRDVATRLKLKVLGTGKTQGVGGEQDANVVTIDKLTLGSESQRLVMGRHTALAADLSRWHKDFGVEFGGLLGATLWGQRPFTIDYRARSITFYERDQFKAPVGARKERLQFTDGHPAVEATINDQFRALAVLDTGHEYSLDISDWFVQRHPTLFDRAASLPGFAQGVGGKAERWGTAIDSFSVFGNRGERLPVTFGRADQPPKPMPDLVRPLPESPSLGILGARELRHYRLTFDYLYEAIYSERQPDDPLLDPTGKPVDPNAVDSLGLPLLVLAVRNRDLDTTRRVLVAGANPNVGTKEGITPLQIATAFNHAELVKLLLAHRADANAPLKGGHTVLHGAAQQGYTEVAAALLEGGAKAAARDQRGITPLMVASLGGHVALVELLVKHGASVSEVDAAGQTPLHFAVAGNRAETIAALLRLGAPQHLRSRTGHTPLDLARAKKFTAAVELLEPDGAKE